MGSQSAPATPVAVTSIRIERDQLERFRRIAEANRRSVSQELRWVIDQRIREFEHEEEAA